MNDMFSRILRQKRLFAFAVHKSPKLRFEYKRESMEVEIYAGRKSGEANNLTGGNKKF